jgi:hypothetical protein
MRLRIIAALTVTFGALATPGGASAGIWAWRCQGQLGEQQVIFNRDSMAVIDSKQPLGDIRHNDAKTITLLQEAGVTYQPQNSNDGLTSPIEFIRADDAKRKIVLTEKTSRRTSHQHKMICGRDEDTDIYRKVYRFEREAEPAHDITMQCLEYQLSTAGGRRCD